MEKTSTDEFNRKLIQLKREPVNCKIGPKESLTRKIKKGNYRIID